MLNKCPVMYTKFFVNSINVAFCVHMLNLVGINVTSGKKNIKNVIINVAKVVIILFYVLRKMLKNRNTMRKSCFFVT